MQVSQIVKGEPRQIYDAWLDTERHSRFAGNRAEINPTEGSIFVVGDNEITGTNRQLQAGGLILQSLRGRDFPADSPDSLVEVRFEPVGGVGTRVTVTHQDVPDAVAERYHDYWHSFFARLLAFFGAPEEAKIALATRGAEPKIPRKRALKEKPRRKPARKRPSMVAAKAGKGLPKAARPKPGKSAGKKTARALVAGAAVARRKAAAKKAPARGAAAAGSRRAAPRAAARVASKKSKAKGPSRPRGRRR